MNSIVFYFIFVLSVFLSAISQIILKRGAEKYKGNKNSRKKYFNWHIFTGYSIFLICTILTVIAFMKVPMKYGPIIESLGYIFVLILAKFFLNEKIGIRKITGNILIVIGIIIFCF